MMVVRVGIGPTAGSWGYEMFLRIGVKYGPIKDVVLVDGELWVVIEAVAPPECDGEVILLQVSKLMPFAQDEVRMWMETTRMPA